MYQVYGEAPTRQLESARRIIHVLSGEKIDKFDAALRVQASPPHERFLAGRMQATLYAIRRTPHKNLRAR